MSPLYDPHQRACLLIGQISLTFAELENDIDQWIHGLADPASPATPRMLRKLDFGQKMDTVHDILMQRHAQDTKALIELHNWRRRLKRYRACRNGLVHGRWDDVSQTVHRERDPEKLPDTHGRIRKSFNVHEMSSELDALQQFRTLTAREWLTSM